MLLCGGNSSGKSTTFLKFFEGCLIRKIKGMDFYKRILFGRIVVYGAGSDSPQELQQHNTKTLCDLEWVIENVEKRIRLCEEDCKGEPYVLVIPWGMYENRARDQLNEECFLKPIEWLREEKRFEVLPIYLRKMNKHAQHRAKKDELARRVCVKEFESHGKEDCDKSKERGIYQEAGYEVKHHPTVNMDKK